MYGFSKQNELREEFISSFTFSFVLCLVKEEEEYKQKKSCILNADSMNFWEKMITVVREKVFRSSNLWGAQDKREIFRDDDDVMHLFRKWTFFLLYLA